MAQNISLLQAAYRFASKLFAEYALDSNGDPIGFTGPNGNAGWIDAGFFGASPSATAAQNVAAIQAAVDYANSQGGGRVSITVPGIYQVAGKQTYSGTNVLSDYGMVTIGDNTEIYIGAGVTLQTPSVASGLYAQAIFTNKNVASNHSVVSNNNFTSGAIGDWTGSPKYTQSGYTVTVTGLVGNTLPVGAQVVLNGTSMSSVRCVLTGTSATGFVATSPNTQTVGSATAIALIAYTLNTSAAQNLNYVVQFNTSAAHNLVGGGYVLFTGNDAASVAGDTSEYNWNRTWLVTSVLSPTSFTVASYYLNAPQAVSGTVWAYPANDNIRITNEGVVDGQMNTNTLSSKWGGVLPLSLTYFNKVGKLNFAGKGEWINTVVISSVCNFDNLLADDITHRYGANGFQLEGPFRNAFFRNCTCNGMQEFLFVGTTDYTGSGGEMQDLDGTVNSGGNIDCVSLDGFIPTFMTERCIDTYASLNYATTGSYTISKFDIRNVRFSSSATGQSTLVTINANGGIYGQFSIKNTTCDFPLTSPLVELFNTSSTFTMDTLNIDEAVVTTGNLTNAELESVVAYPYTLLEFATYTSGTINKVKVSNSTIPMYPPTSGNPSNGISMGAAWAVNSFECNNMIFNEVNTGGTVTSAGLSIYAKQIKLNTCTLNYVNTGAALLQSRMANSIVDIINCTVATSGSNHNSTLFQPFANTTVTMINCNLSSAQYACPIFWNGSGVYVINATYGGINLGTSTGAVLAYNYPSGCTFNIRSLGGNITASGANFSGASTYNFYGNCSDMKVDATIVTKQDGASIYNTNSSAGTLGHAGVVSCDYDSVTAGLLWKRITGITAGVPAIGTY